MLTQRQQTVLFAIKRFLNDRGRQPTLEEIGEMLGVTSRSTVHKHIQLLISKGYLRKAMGKAAYELQLANQPAEGSLPLLGRIAAGQPIEAIPGEDSIDLAAHFCGPSRYVLRVSGHSMIEKGILDNDYIVVKKQDMAENGDIVVALINRWEATLKSFYLQTDGQVELRPANRDMSSLYYPADQVSIQGVMIGLFRDHPGLL